MMIEPNIYVSWKADWYETETNKKSSYFKHL